MSDVNSLFQSAADEGELSPEALGVLQVADVGAQIQNALGVDPDEFEASEVILMTQMPDDSGSIRFAGNSQVMRDGHNLVLESLGGTKQADAVLAMCRYLNGHVLYPYSPLAQAVRMDSNNYDPNHGTPLYDETVVLLGAVLAKAQEFADNGIVARTVTLIISDGADVHSRRNTPTDVAKLVKDMLKQENHIVAAMGIDDGDTDFRQVFSEMGILDEWILTPGNSESEIRAAFQTVSQSAVRASQGGASFSQTAMGGFGS
ncbi:MAG: hypothetical protein HN929_11885 [Chloroflexi bacterium]|jgi:hypothetical protein|nr:hypothetical protein [Candidatus Parcubacteria bacterium]MBT7082139.1 hypothetical protein [Chloroflexota bacterium]